MEEALKRVRLLILREMLRALAEPQFPELEPEEEEEEDDFENGISVAKGS